MFPAVPEPKESAAGWKAAPTRMACQVAPRSAALSGSVWCSNARVTQMRWCATTLNLLSSSACVGDRWRTHSSSS